MIIGHSISIPSPRTALPLVLPTGTFQSDLVLWYDPSRDITTDEASINSDMTTWSTDNIASVTGDGGTPEVYTVTEDTSTGSVHQFNDSTQYTGIVSGSRKIAFEVRALNRSWLSVRIGSEMNVFDIANGAVGTATVNGGANVSADITDVGGGWYRITMVHVTSSTLVQIRTERGDSITAFDGNGLPAFEMRSLQATQIRASDLGDLSGDGHTATQSTDAGQPLLGPNALGEQNILDFDGTSDLMIVGAGSGWPASSKKSHSLFLLVNPRLSGTTLDYYIDFGTGTSNRLVFVQSGSVADRVGWYDGSWHNIALSTSGWQILEWHLPEGSNGEVLRNGTSLGTAAYTAHPLGGTVGMMADPASANFNEGQLGPMVLASFASGTATEAQREQVRKYLRDFAKKEGIVLP